MPAKVLHNTINKVKILNLIKGKEDGNRGSDCDSGSDSDSDRGCCRKVYNNIDSN